MLTARVSKRKHAVDYAVGGLVNDSVSELRRIIPEFAPIQLTELQEELRDRVENVECFLKCVFGENHIGKDNSGFHCSELALDSRATAEADSKPVDCTGCFATFSVLGELQCIIPSERLDAKQVILDCQEKPVQYNAHLHRVRMQKVCIADTISEIVSNCVA